MVDRQNGMPLSAAAAEPAYSPSVCIIRVKPVGARPTGMLIFVPKTSVERSASVTSRRTPGLNSRSR